MGLKCWGCLKLCPPVNPHLVTAACDMVLKSEPFFFFFFFSARTHAQTHTLWCVVGVEIVSSCRFCFVFKCYLPTSLPYCSEKVPASLWRLDLDCQGLGTVQLLRGQLQARHYLF